MTKRRHSLKSAVVSLAVAYALFAQAFLAAIVVTQATAAANANIICLGGNPGTPGHGDKLPSKSDACVLCSLSACSGAGGMLPVADAPAVPPSRAASRVTLAVLTAQQLPQPHRTPKLSQAPPQTA